MRTIIDITTLWASLFKTSIRFTKKKNVMRNVTMF